MAINKTTTRKAVSALLLTLGFTSAPAADMVTLEHANTLEFNKEELPDAQVLRGDVTFAHEGATMRCDYAHFYAGSNSFDAFGNVRMTQGDTLFVYGDVLHYDGTTKYARLRGNCRLINRDASLVTDSLDYNRITQTGFYFTGGHLSDETNSLTSVYGQYCTATKMADFKGDVRVLSPDAALAAPSLQYSTKKNTVYFSSPTVIEYKGETSGYTENGYYDTDRKYLFATRNSRIDRVDKSRLKADTLIYDEPRGEAWCHGNAEADVPEHHVAISAGFIYLYQNPDSVAIAAAQVAKGDTAGIVDALADFKGRCARFALATQKAVAMEYSSRDTLRLAADTLLAFQQLTDTTLKQAYGLHNTRFYRPDIQGTCDTLHFFSPDTSITMLYRPVLFSDTTQLRGEIIVARLDTAFRPYRINVLKWASGTMRDDSTHYNEVEGKTLIAHLSDGQLRRVEVEGNAEAIYTARDEDGDLVGVNRSETSKIEIFMKDKELEKIVMTPESSGVLYPDKMMPEDTRHLNRFVWLEDLRPTSGDDLWRRNVDYLPKEKKTSRRKSK